MENKKEYKQFDPKPYTKAEVDKIMEEIDAKMVSFMKEGKYKDVLISMGNLGKYSFTNQMYILLQKDNATCVNGMRGWNYLGRSIKPGEKSIRIFAPITGKVERDILDEFGKPVLDNDGNPSKKEVDIVKGYKPSFVFDVSQTQGKELDVFKMDEHTSVEQKDLILNGLENVISTKGFSFEYATEEELGSGCYGLCNHQEKKIKLLKGMSDVQTVSTAIHECGHALAHGTNYHKGFEGLTPNEKREIKEVEAESIACVVCSHLGLNNENFNFSYITGWADGDLSKFRKNLDVIGSCSLKLIEGIDKELEADRIKKKEHSIEIDDGIPDPDPIPKRRHRRKLVEVEAV